MEGVELRSGNLEVRVFRGRLTFAFEIVVPGVRLGDGLALRSQITIK